MTELKTDEDLQRVCAEWQEVLRLQDWDVQIRFVRHFGLHHTQQANCSNTVNKKSAQIRILRPDDYSNDEWPQDIEKTIVHELLHLHTAPFTEASPGKYELMLEEQMIDRLAGAFVKLKRKQSESSVIA